MAGGAGRGVRHGSAQLLRRAGRGSQGDRRRQERHLGQGQGGGASQRFRRRRNPRAGVVRFGFVVSWAA